MNVSTKLFWILAVFFLLGDITYIVWSLVDEYTGKVEWVGAGGLTLVTIMSAFIAFYIGRVHKAQGGELPEDRNDANIDDGDAEQGFFSPWSWWPITLAAGAALVFLGLAIGVWIAFIGAALTFVSVVGWIYEYYRGNFGH